MDHILKENSQHSTPICYTKDLEKSGNYTKGPTILLQPQDELTPTRSFAPEHHTTNLDLPNRRSDTRHGKVACHPREEIISRQTPRFGQTARPHAPMRSSAELQQHHQPNHQERRRRKQRTSRNSKSREDPNLRRQIRRATEGNKSDQEEPHELVAGTGSNAGEVEEELGEVEEEHALALQLPPGNDTLPLEGPNLQRR